MIEWKKYDRVEEVRQVGRGRRRRERVVEGTGWEGRGVDRRERKGGEGKGRAGERRGCKGRGGDDGKGGEGGEGDRDGSRLDDSACNTHAEYSH